MKISNNGLDLIKKYEGCYLNAYKCPAGVWTIGYGHTTSFQGESITQEQADRLLIEDVEKFEKKVNNYNSIYNWNQNEFDALVSFAFNIGSINQLTQNGKRSKSQIANAIPLYNKASGKVLSGLTKRRLEEQKLFNTPISTSQLGETGSPVISRGSTGEYVKEFQQFLTDNEFNVGIIDGVFGKQTEKCMYAYKKLRNLPPINCVDAEVWFDIQTVKNL